MDSDYLQIGGLKKLIADDIKIETSMEEKGNIRDSIILCEKIINNLHMLKKLDGNNPSYDALIKSWDKRKTEILNNNPKTLKKHESKQESKKTSNGLIG